MSRFFAVIFNWFGLRWARRWKARVDEPILREIVNTLRKSGPNGWKARGDVQLDSRFYSAARDYETAETMAEERAANLMAANQKALSDAEIGLVICERTKGTPFNQMPGELQAIADRYGLNGVKKRNSKPTPPEKVSEASNDGAN